MCALKDLSLHLWWFERTITRMACASMAPHTVAVRVGHTLGSEVADPLTSFGSQNLRTAQ